MAGKLVVIAIIGVVLLYLFVPGVQQLGTRLLTTSEEITLPGKSTSTLSQSAERSVDLVTLLGFDAIPAILEPRIITSLEAEQQLDPDQRVLGVSIGGRHRAYPINVLSRHEIVNDVVGGKPIAVTW